MLFCQRGSTVPEKLSAICGLCAYKNFSPLSKNSKQTMFRVSEYNKKLIYFVGLVDILTYYGFKKRLVDWIDFCTSLKFCRTSTSFVQVNWKKEVEGYCTRLRYMNYFHQEVARIPKKLWRNCMNGKWRKNSICLMEWNIRFIFTALSSWLTWLGKSLMWLEDEGFRKQEGS